MTYHNGDNPVDDQGYRLIPTAILCAIEQLPDQAKKIDQDKPGNRPLVLLCPLEQRAAIICQFDSLFHILMIYQYKESAYSLELH
jgi:hypothetical protein